MEVVFGGKVEHLRPFLLEEKIVEGWVPVNKLRNGITLAAFNVASLKVALHTKTVPPNVAPPVAEDNTK